MLLAIATLEHKAIWEDTNIERTFKTFWSAIKSQLAEGTLRCFITGKCPLPLNDIGSGNVARDLSSDNDVAELCGLTSMDIKVALKMICGLDTSACEQHLSIMKNYFSGYRFYRQEKNPNCITLKVP